MGTLFIQQILNNSLNTYYAEKSWDKVSLSSFYREGKWGRETNLSKVKMPLSEWKVTQSDSLWPRGLYSWWNSPGQNTGVGSCSLLQAIFPTQGSNPGLPHYSRFFTSWTTREAPAELGPNPGLLGSKSGPVGLHAHCLVRMHMKSLFTFFLKSSVICYFL